MSGEARHPLPSAQSSRGIKMKAEGVTQGREERAWRGQGCQAQEVCSPALFLSQMVGWFLLRPSHPANHELARD